MKTALTIAGSDSSGGAGIQADIKTMMANGVYAMSAVTSLTAQNTAGVKAIFDVSGKFLAEQIDAVFQDIPPDAVKIGMVSSEELIRTIAEKLREYQAEKIVLDPVMVATSGAKLISEDAVSVLKQELIPLADLITPNLPEAEVLSGMTIRTREDMEKAAIAVCRDFGVNVLLKGGHQVCTADDLLAACSKEDKIPLTWFSGKRIDNPNTHGTGCTLSSAIAANLAKGYSMTDSIQRAKAYLSGALKDGLNLGNGSGPLNHGYALCGKFTENEA